MDDIMYYVASNDDSPEALYFSEEDAFAHGFDYIDVFDDIGNKLMSYKLLSDYNYSENTSEEDYTTDF